jgi:hypothetical protein
MLINDYVKHSDSGIWVSTVITERRALPESGADFVIAPTAGATVDWPGLGSRPVWRVAWNRRSVDFAPP